MKNNGSKVSFICNVCGNENIEVLLAEVENREFQSCRHCGSSSWCFCTNTICEPP